MEDKKLFGYLVEFISPKDVLHAAEKVRDEGFKNWDVYTPFPVHGMDQAMGIKRTNLPWIVMGAGITGCGVAFLMQWYTNAFNYPIIISGKPLFGIPANIPIAFELIVLFSALAAFFGLMAMNGLPQWYNPLFNNKRFRNVTTDKYCIVIEANDPKFDKNKTMNFLSSLGGSSVETIEE